MAKEEAEEKAKAEAEEEEEEGRTKKRTANCTKKLRTLTQDQEPPGRTAGNHSETHRQELGNGLTQ